MASRPGTAQISSLTEAVATLVGDGDSVALEGFTHLIPFAAGHELIRQGRRELELVRMMPDLLYGQMIGMGTRGGWSSPSHTPRSRPGRLARRPVGTFGWRRNRRRPSLRAGPSWKRCGSW